MGIKAKVIGGIGTIVVGGLATWLGIRKKRGQQLDKVNTMISDVDLKEQEEPEEGEVKTVDEMSNDVDDAIRGMDIDEETETVDKINANSGD